MMGCMWFIPPLLVATLVLAEYYIDNADASVVYSKPANISGQAWQTYSVDTQRETFSITDSTGNHTFTIDPSYCYDQNYAYGKCATTDNCSIEVPFTGSGITIFALNAGSTGMGARFSVDNGEAKSKTIAPPPPPSYQIFKMSIYQIYGLQTGNHTIRITVIDRGGITTVMRFDYAEVNETFVASSTPSETATTTLMPSKPPSSTASANNSTSYGDIIGATLGGVALLVSLVLIGFFYLRKRKAAAAWHQGVSPPNSNVHPSSFTTELNSPSLSPPVRRTSSRERITPFTYHTIPHDNRSASQYSSHGPDYSSQSIRSERSLRSLQPLRRSPSQGEGNGIHADMTGSRVASPGSSVLGSQNASQLNLTAEQVEVINRLQRDSVPMDTIARVMEGFLSSNVDAGANDKKLNRLENSLSTASPPSYREREGI